MARKEKKAVSSEKKQKLKFKQELKAAKNGDVNSQFSVAEAYMNGKGVKEDKKRAFEYFSFAADNGHPDAQHKLGYCYLHGYGIAKDYKKASDLFENSALAQNPEGQFWYGYVHLFGYGREPSAFIAAKFFALSAEKDNAFAQFWLAYCYMHSIGVTSSRYKWEDYRIAVRLFEKSSEQGHEGATQCLKDLIASRPYLADELKEKNRNKYLEKEDRDDFKDNTVILEDVKKEEKKLSTKIPIFDRSRMKIEKRIRKGPFSERSKGRLQISKDKWIPVIIQMPREELEAGQLEVIHERPKHPNLVEHIGIVNINGLSYLLSPWCEYGLLRKYLKIKTFKEKLGVGTSEGFCTMALQIANGIKALHKANILHLDIMLNNLILTDELNVAIQHSRLSRRTETAKLEVRLDPAIRLPYRWISPESLETRIFTEKSDVWSLGVCFYEILTIGKKPYIDAEFQNKLKLKLGVINNEYMLKFTENEKKTIDKRCIDIIRMCLQYDENQRSSLDDIIAALEKFKHEIERDEYMKIQAETGTFQKDYSIVQNSERLAEYLKKLQQRIGNHPNLRLYPKTTTNIKDFTCKDSKMALKAITNMCKGVMTLHENGFVHGNLCCKNLKEIETKNGFEFMVDGLSEHRNPTFDRWRAPEILRDPSSAPTPSADIWSIGMCISEILSGGKHPYDDIASFDEKTKAEIAEEKLKPSLPSTNITEEKVSLTALKVVFRACTSHTPEGRPKVQRLCSILDSIEQIQDAERGVAKWNRSRIMIVGRGRVGKTSLFKSIRGTKFDPLEQSTAGAEVGDVTISDHCAFETARGEVVIESFAKGSNSENAIASTLCALDQSQLVPESKNELKEAKVSLEEESEIKVKEDTTDVSKDSPKEKPVVSATNISKEIELISSEVVNVEESKLVEKQEVIEVKTDADTKTEVKEIIEKKSDIGKILGYMVHDSVVVSVWDFGGQEVFYTSHSLFMVRNSIYLVTFSLLNWNEDITSEMHYILFWLMSIQTFAPGAKFFLVGTHRDTIEKEIKDEEERHDYYLDVSMMLLDIIERVFGEDRDKYLVRFSDGSQKLDFFPVDNSREDDKVIKILKEKVFKTLKEQDTTSRKVATSWTKVCDHLTTRVEKNWMTVKEVSQLAKQFGIETETETRRMLETFNELGTSVYFNHPGLNDYVIIHPQFLMECVKQIIFDKKLHMKLRYNLRTDSEAPVSVKDMEKEFFLDGIAKEELLVYLWKKVCIEHRHRKKVNEKKSVNDKEAVSAAKFVLSLLEKFMLLCRIGESEYVVPGMVRRDKNEKRMTYSRFQKRTLKQRTLPEDEKTEKFCIKFTQFVPRSFYEMLVVKIVNNLGDSSVVKQLFGDYEKSKQHHTIFKSMASLRVGDIQFTMSGLKTLSQLIHEAKSKEEKGYSSSERNSEDPLSTHNVVTVEAPREYCSEILKLVMDSAKEIRLFPFNSRLTFEFSLSHFCEKRRRYFHVDLQELKNAFSRCSPLDLESKCNRSIRLPYADLMHWDLFFSQLQRHPTIVRAIEKLYPKFMKCFAKNGLKPILEICTGKSEIELRKELDRTLNVLGRATELDIYIIRKLLWILRPTQVINAEDIATFRLRFEEWIEKINVKDEDEKQLKATMFGTILNFHENSIKLEKKCIGKGYFGRVFRGELDHENEKVNVAVKIPRESFDFNELQAMYALPGHRNILKLLGLVTFAKTKKICLVTPFCELGSLKGLHKNPKIDMQSHDGFLRISYQIASGLASLHAAGIIHRDLSCKNILMREDFSIAIADYGLSRKGKKVVDKGKMHVLWTAPECLRTATFTPKSDIWSLGVTLWEMLTKGKKPYSDKWMTAQMKLKRIKEGKMKLQLTKEEEKKTSVDCIRLMYYCLEFDEQKRPSIQDVLKQIKSLKKDKRGADIDEYGIRVSEYEGGIKVSETELKLTRQDTRDSYYGAKPV
mmetsp:Transcript_14933/g.22600  ORF Transcript_14933/g.22600 Transcript_14933/m.22600 type:complete len:1935 (+) Transcript_14933:13-5817(+)